MGLRRRGAGLRPRGHQLQPPRQQRHLLEQQLVQEVLAWLLLGLLLGSFANVCIYRIPQKRSIVHPRSACPRCGRLIRWYDNIPVLSYLLLRGRCRDCGARIAPRYPAVEALTGALLAAACLRAGGGAAAALGALFVWQLLVMAFIDYDHRIIPDGLSLALFATGLACAAWNPQLGGPATARVAGAFAGAAAGFGTMWLVAWGGERLWKREALGGGDIKLMAGIGAWLGWRGAMFSLFAGSLLGTVWALAMMARRGYRRHSYIPFGPFLAAGAWLGWMLFPGGAWPDLFKVP